MSDFRRPLVGALLALCASISFASRSIVPPKFNEEMMQKHQDGSHLALAFWMSTEMFKNSVTGKMPASDVQKIVDALKGYAIYGLMDVTFDTEQGALVPSDRVQLRSSARLQLGDRAPRAIVAMSDQPPGVRAALQVMKPMMASLLGKFGDSIEFVAFDDADEHGDSLADPRGNLDAIVTFDKEQFVWRLPLVSLRPLRVDPATGHTFPGDFDFSPFTGNKLTVQK